MLLLVSLGLLFLAAPVWSNMALGNLAVTIKNNKLISTNEKPLRGNTPDLWCQLSNDHAVVPMTSARFIRARDRKTFEAVLDEKNLKARLVFGDALVTDAGKYRCEMKTLDGDLVYGNMFVFARPIVHTNGSREYKMAEHDPTLIEGEEVPVQLGEKVEITCPVVGFPVPTVVWFKDGLPVEDEDRVSFSPKNTLTIGKVVETDIGKYRCVASNQYAAIVDGPEQQYELKLDQSLVLTGQHGWILPLVIILIILLLVFICIYAWQACSRFNSANYNVARREQNLRREREEEQRRLTKETP